MQRAHSAATRESIQFVSSQAPRDRYSRGLRVSASTRKRTRRPRKPSSTWRTSWRRFSVIVTQLPGNRKRPLASTPRWDEFILKMFDTQKPHRFAGGGWEVVVRPVCQCSKSATQKSAWIYVLQFGSELCNYFVWVRRLWWFWTCKDTDEYVLHFLLWVYVAQLKKTGHSIKC